MCVDPKEIVVRAVRGHVHSEVPVSDAARPIENSEETDTESEKRVRAEEAALEAWLRGRGGQPWADGIVMECVDRFSALDRFQVSVVIYRLRDEAGALDKKKAAEESIREHGFDFEELSEEEIEAILIAGQESPEAVMAVCESLKDKYKRRKPEQEVTAIVEAAQPRA
jgi:hypothetical protein